MDSAVTVPTVTLPSSPQLNVDLPSEDTQVTRLVVAVHGIGKQFRYSTIQAVTARFASYCQRPITQPLGAFHPDRVILEPDSPELGAYLFEPPVNYTNEFQGFGFAEAFWADIPEIASATKNTTEETKAWAQTVVERVRLLDQTGSGHSDLIDYKKASAVVEEMVNTIQVLENLLFIATKAGLFKFDLGQLLTDFVGCVQIVADFKDYGGNVFDRFATTMRNLAQRMPHLKEIYIVAHSEGTVVSFKGLLKAMAAPRSPDNAWVDLVKGYMTIGSPLNKHIVMWPRLWQNVRPAPGRDRPDPIRWRNYYDYGDPVGFDLEITRDWMHENGWLSENGAGFFQFSKDYDYGFTRYPFPGEAHNDYWNDDGVFGHFIDDVVLKKDGVPKPGTIPWAVFVSNVLPYVLCAVILTGGVYVLYRTLVGTFVKEFPDPGHVLRDVIGITCLLAGTTVLSRIPRLDKIQIWPKVKIWPAVVGVSIFVAGALGYFFSVSSGTKNFLSTAFWIPNGIIYFFLAVSLASAISNKLKPRWGMVPLIALGGVAALLVLLKLLAGDPAAFGQSFWALLLANAGFLYLWWLSTLLFDLVYIWHQFIRSFRTTAVLRSLRAEARSDLRA
jgi:hypothetical protein